MPEDMSVSSSPSEKPPVKAVETPNNRNALWRSRIARCRTHRDKLVPEWRTNVDYRRGKQFETDSDQDRIAITTDWGGTKTKQSQLYSQTPEVRLTARHKRYEGSVPTFAKKLNETIEYAKVGVVMDENVPDCVNAAGIAACIVTYDARTAPKSVPTVPPEVAAQMQQAGIQVPMNTIQVPVDTRITANRISPENFLWPIEFSGSDFDKAPWLGQSGQLLWPAAKHAFSLKDEDKASLTGGAVNDTLIREPDKDQDREPDIVNYDELFYWRYLFHEDETHFKAIHRLVFIQGKEEPVVDEPWKGQKRASDGSVIGSCVFPIRVLTLTYISDEAIPPSDSAMGRPQVDELIRSRSQMLQQREHSLPMRWADTNRMDPLVLDSIQRGTWQGIIPVNGSGTNAMGEIARANYSNEDFEFQRVAESDLDRVWQTTEGAGRPTPASRSATASRNMNATASTRIAYERGRTARYFLGIAEVIAGLLALYGTFTQEESEALQAWDRESLANNYVYSVRADSTVLLDAEQRIERLMAFLNMTAKSGFVDVEPVIREIADLSGLDPSKIVRAPQPPPPEPMNISLRASGLEDLLNPLFLAFLVESKQAPRPESLDIAKQMLLASNIPPPPPAPPAPPAGPEGMPPPLGEENAAPAPLEDSNPKWNTLSRVEKRSQDGPGGTGA